MTEIGGQPPLNYRLSNFASSPPANYLWLNDSSRGWSNSIVRIRVRCCVQFYDLIDAPFFFFFFTRTWKKSLGRIARTWKFFFKVFWCQLLWKIVWKILENRSYRSSPKIFQEIAQSLPKEKEENEISRNSRNSKFSKKLPKRKK